mgnify:CR=1 FL=1
MSGGLAALLDDIAAMAKVAAASVDDVAAAAGRASAKAAGVVIDDAIVVLENIFRFIEEKRMEPFEAAKAATADIGLAVLATTFSLVVIFLPVFGAMVLAVLIALLRGIEVPWGMFGYYTALLAVMAACFLGIGMLISALARSTDMAQGAAFVVWLTLLLFLKMAQETGAEHRLPKACRWADLKALTGLKQHSAYRQMLVDIPVWVITASTPALVGASCALDSVIET